MIQLNIIQQYPIYPTNLRSDPGHSTYVKWSLFLFLKAKMFFFFVLTDRTAVHFCTFIIQQQSDFPKQQATFIIRIYRRL